MKKTIKRQCIIIHGATGVGKSDTAVQLAQQYGGHIINGDVGQFYTPLAIGTAKPDWQHEKVPHHLFDLIDTPHSYTVVEYRTLVLEKMEELWAQGILPIIVGGSGFYIRSLFFPPCQPTESEEDSFTVVPEVSWDALHALDPERAKTIKPQDGYRIERALRMLTTGQQPSECKPTYQSLDCDVLLVWLERDRKELYERINQRLVQMMDQGWLAEAANLTPEWQEFLMNKKIIGYDLLLAYQNGEIQEPLDRVVELIAQKTRNYAKRQHTFWRMLKKTVEPHFHAPSRVEEISLSKQDSYTLLTTIVDRFIKETT